MKNIPLYEVRKIANLKDMINSSAEIYGNKTAFLRKIKGKEGYHPVSYMQYKKDIDAFGTALLSLGLKGKKIALIGENRYEWSTSYLAVVNGVGVIVPLDKELPENEIKNLLIRAEVDAIIYSDSNKEQIENISKESDLTKYYISMEDVKDEGKLISFSSLLKKGYELLNSGDRSYLDAEIDTKAMNILLFTSATTDKSKAVMLSHENICSNLMAMCSMIYIGEEDIFLSVLPIHHTYECTCGFLCPIYRGAKVAYCEGLRHIPKNLQESKATVMLGVPLIFEAIYRRIWDQAKKSGMDKKLKTGIKISNFLRKFNIDITKKLFKAIHDNFGGHIRLFISGAAGIEPSISKGFRDMGIFFLQGYGLTECSPIAAVNRDVDFKDSAAGLPVPGVEVKVINKDQDGIGEIIVKGKNVMLGYYKDEEATSKVFKDGWFYTGDLGYMDEDQFVYITGRKKNVIVTKNGKNIFPEEIEVLLARSPFIKESLVYGKDDEESGDVIVSAVIVPDMDVIEAEFKDKPLSKEEIYQLIQNEVKTVNKSLVTYKYVKNIKLREDEFIKTTTKKIKRYMEHLD